MPDRFATGGKTLCVCGRTQRRVSMRTRRFFLPTPTHDHSDLGAGQKKACSERGCRLSRQTPPNKQTRDEGRGFCGLLTDNAVHGQPRRDMSVLWTVTPRPSIPMGTNVRSPVFIFRDDNRAGLRLDILRLHHAKYRACSLAGSKTVFQTRPSILGRPPGDGGRRMGDSGQILLKNGDGNRAE